MRSPRKSNSALLPDTSAPPGENELADDPRKRDVPAVRRALAILWHLSRNFEGLTLSRIARDLDIIPSTCLHILRELMAGRFVTYDLASKTYRLGNGVLQLARDLSSQNLFARIAQPYLDRIARDFEVRAQAQEREGPNDIVVVANAVVVSGDIVTLGGRVPVLSGATGRLIAAYSGWGDAELRKCYDRVRWQNPLDFAAWLLEVRTTHGRRHAVDKGRLRKGITSIAGAVFSKDGTVSRTVSVTAVSAQLGNKRLNALIAAVERASKEMTTAMR